MTLRGKKSNTGTQCEKGGHRMNVNVSMDDNKIVNKNSVMSTDQTNHSKSHKVDSYGSGRVPSSAPDASISIGGSPRVNSTCKDEHLNVKNDAKIRESSTVQSPSIFLDSVRGCAPNRVNVKALGDARCVKEKSQLSLRSIIPSPHRVLSLQPRKISVNALSNENDTVPSLCSSVSGLQSTSSPDSQIISHDVSGEVNSQSNTTFVPKIKRSKENTLNPNSIACSSSIDTQHSSPLHSKLPRPEKNVMFSPTPSSHPFEEDKKFRRSPTRSPVSRNQLTSLPNFDDCNLESPGFFLSPHMNSPTKYGSEVTNWTRKSDFQDLKTSPKSYAFEADSDISKKDRDRMTPTSFVTGFGKVDVSSVCPSDGNNVLSWLQSPTVNSLFSPGVLSWTNTPKGWFGIAPPTPHTPKLSVGPNDGLEFCSILSPKSGKIKGKHPNQGSTMISVSPLSSSKRIPSCVTSENNAVLQDNSEHIGEVFASPKPDFLNKLPHLSKSEKESLASAELHSVQSSLSKKVVSSPKNKKTNYYLEAHMAERDLMEDEDLSVLLQLAQTTPRAQPDKGVELSAEQSNEPCDSHVFRSPLLQKNSAIHSKADTLPPSSLQLPIIGKFGREMNSKPNKSPLPKQQFTCKDEFTPPSLGMRSLTSTGSREHLGQKIDESKSNKAKSRILPKLQKNSIGKASRREGNKHTQSLKKEKGSRLKHKPQHIGQQVGRRSGNENVTNQHNMPLTNAYNVHQKYMQNHHMPPHVHPPPAHAVYSHHPNLHPHSMPGHVPYHHYSYPSAHPPPNYTYSMYNNPPPVPPVPMPVKPFKMASTKNQHKNLSQIDGKRSSQQSLPSNKRLKKSSPKGKGSVSLGKKASKSSISPTALKPPVDRQKAAAAITAMNAASGKKNDKAAALAAAILRGVTMRPSGKWQAQLYYAGKSRYIGVFDTREKAALAYEIAREKLKTDKSPADQSAQSVKETEDNVNAARKAAFEGVNEKDPRSGVTK